MRPVLCECKVCGTIKQFFTKYENEDFCQCFDNDNVHCYSEDTLVGDVKADYERLYRKWKYKGYDKTMKGIDL